MRPDLGDAPDAVLPTACQLVRPQGAAEADHVRVLPSDASTEIADGGMCVAALDQRSGQAIAAGELLADHGGIGKVGRRADDVHLVARERRRARHAGNGDDRQNGGFQGAFHGWFLGFWAEARAWGPRRLGCRRLSAAGILGAEGTYVRAKFRLDFKPPGFWFESFRNHDSRKGANVMEMTNRATKTVPAAALGLLVVRTGRTDAGQSAESLRGPAPPSPARRGRRSSCPCRSSRRG